MENFYLLKLKLNNYRKFESKEITFNNRMNVIIGKNSSGKTAILEAVNVMLGAYLAAYSKYVPSRYVFNISKMDPTLKAKVIKDQSVLTPDTVAQYPCSVECKMQWDGKKINFQRMVEQSEGRTKFKSNNPMQQYVKSWEDKIQMANNEDRTLILPIVLYLSSARLWNENRNSDVSSLPSRTDAYKNCLDKKHGTQLVFDYIKTIKNIANEENKGIAFSVYDVLMDAVQIGLKDELQDGDKVMFSSRFNDIALMKKDNTVLQFDSLSDGYRNVIKIILDVAVRMCILNPYLRENVLRLTPGIVIIDEIDLSLHPTWQKRIISILKEIFPKVQFICATHSPFIIQSLEQGELLSLEDIIDEEYSGQSIEDIAEDIMGVAVPQYSEKKQQMYKAAADYFNSLEKSITGKDLEELKIKMDILEAEYSDNPAYKALIQQKYHEKYIELEKNNAASK